MLFEDILTQLGEFGKYQRYVYVLAAIPGLFTGLHNLNIVFILAVPKFRCAIPGFPNDTYDIQNDDHAAAINSTIPADDSCHVYDWIGDNNQTSVPCDAWVYDRSVFTETAVTEFNLVCQNTILKSITTMVFYPGMLFGGLIGGRLADRFGRKIVVFVGGIGMTVNGFVLAFSPNVYALMAFRFIAAFTEMACFAAIFVLGMELVGKSKRMIAGICMGAFFTAGYCLVTPFAYFIRNWRYMQIALAVPLLFMFAYWWVLPESPRWLLNRGRRDEAEKILRKAAKVNRVSLPEKLFDSCEELEVKGSDSLLRMMKYKVLFFRMCIVCINWGASSMIYYGLILSSGQLVGNIFVNFLVAGLIDFPAVAFTLLVLNPWGRRKPHCFCMLLAGVSCLSSIFVKLFADPGLTWVLLLLTTVGKFGISAAFNIIYVYTAELNPTSVRAVSIGTGSVCARIFTVVSPYIVDLSDLIGGPTATILPLAVFGSIAITAGLLALFLPETRGRRLPETIEDALHFTRKPKKGTTQVSELNPAFTNSVEDSLDTTDDSRNNAKKRKSKNSPKKARKLEKGANPAFTDDEEAGRAEGLTPL